MIKTNSLHEVFESWNKLTFSKLLTIDQTAGFKLEFIIDERTSLSQRFLAQIRNTTVKKHPAGIISWLGHWGSVGLQSQFRKYRIDFIDPIIKEQIDQEKLEYYINELKEILEKSKNMYEV